MHHNIYITTITITINIVIINEQTCTCGRLLRTVNNSEFLFTPAITQSSNQVQPKSDGTFPNVTWGPQYFSKLAGRLKQRYRGLQNRRKYITITCLAAMSSIRLHFGTLIFLPILMLNIHILITKNKAKTEKKTKTTTNKTDIKTKIKAKLQIWNFCRERHADFSAAYNLINAALKYSIVPQGKASIWSQ